MEAKDTVIKDPSNLEWTEEPRDKYAADFSFVDDYPYEVQRICEVQAEISFKAGERETVSKILDKSEHPIFWKNCKAQRKRNAKICQDCPLRQTVIEQGNSAMTMRYGKPNSKNGG